MTEHPAQQQHADELSPQSGSRRLRPTRLQGTTHSYVRVDQTPRAEPSLPTRPSRRLLLGRQSVPDTPRISVVIAHYGDPEMTAVLVDQLRRQEGDEVHEVIVSDDHAPKAYPSGEPGVVVVRRETNGGFGAAVNSGCATATGDYLLILNNDVSIDRTFVRDLYAASAPLMPTLAGPRYAEEWPLAFSSAGYFPTPANVAFARLRLFHRLKSRAWAVRLAGIDARARPGRVVTVDWVVGAVMLLPRWAFDEVSGFDERYFMFHEEIDFQRRLRDCGVSTTFVGTVRADHEGGASTQHPEQLGWRMRSVQRYFRTWGGLVPYRSAATAAHLFNFVWDLAARTTGRRSQPLRELRRWLRLTWRP